MVGNKRQFLLEEEESLPQDDLLVAARYASMTAPPPSIRTIVHNTIDMNEIDLSGEEEEQVTTSSLSSPAVDTSAAAATTNTTSQARSSDPSSFGVSNEPATSDEEDDSSDDDDEPDDSIDLSETIQQRQAPDDTIDSQDQDGVVPPRTVHEIDGYQTELTELEKTLNINLSIQEQQVQNISRKDLKIAGTIQNHMVNERTIIVKGIPDDTVLDEGTLLVITMEGDDTTIVPLGKIFELFGPVNQPLYSIRLPPSRESSEQKNDPWARDGSFTLFLAQTSSDCQVYYLPDAATTVDTQVIYRISGKGCDASNLHDEEVVNPNEMYFSDDEQERRVKNSKRNAGKLKKATIKGEIIATSNSSGQLGGFHGEAEMNARNSSHYSSEQPAAAVPAHNEPDTEYFDDDSD